MTLPQRYFRLLNLDIVIKDINDNQPLFPNSPIYVNVSEKTQINDVIDLDQYQARDADIGLFYSAKNFIKTFTIS